MTLNALVLMGVVFGLVELIESAWPGLGALPASRQKPITVTIVVAVSVGATFLVRSTVWAHEQVIGGHPLDKLSIASTLVACVFVIGLAVASDKFLKAASNFGQNTVKKPIATSLASSPVKAPSSPDSPVAQ